MFRNPQTSRTVRLQLESLEAREVPAVLFGVTQSQRLQTFDSANPSVLLSTVPIRGLLDAGERITDIDVRVGSGELFGRSDGGRIYVINPSTGFVTPISTRVAIGASVGMSFDPTSDQLRIINYSGENYTIDPDTGFPSSIGLPVRYAVNDPFRDQTPRLAAISFTNSIPFALFTQLYGIDHINDTLVIGVDNPNLGTFSTVGSLGIDVTNAVGFDIDPVLRIGYATLQPVGQSLSIFSFINLNTGQVSLVSQVGTARPVFLDIAVAGALTGGGVLGGGLITQPNSFFGSPATQPLDSGVIAPLNPTLVSPINPGLGLNTGGTITTTPLAPGLTQPLAPGLVGSSINSLGPTINTLNSSINSLGSTINSLGQFPFTSFNSIDPFVSGGFVF